MLLAVVALIGASFYYVHGSAHHADGGPAQRLIVISSQFAEEGAGWLLLKNPVDGATEIVVTSDAGVHWRRLRTSAGHPTATIFDFQLIDSQHAVLQSNGGIEMSDDGGASWHEVALPGSAPLGGGIYFLDSRRGWYLQTGTASGAARPAALWSTANGGFTWNRLWVVSSVHPSDGGIPLDGVKNLVGFVTPDLGWMNVLGVAGSYVMATRDGGITWARQDRSDGPAAAVRFFPPSTVVLVLVEPVSYSLMRSADLGVSWRSVGGTPPSVGAGSESQPNLVSSSTWVVPVGRQLMRTSDGGSSWETLAGGMAGGLSIQYVPWLSQAGRGYALVRDQLMNPYIFTTQDGGHVWSDVSAPELIRR